jgi:hypothetical protein
MNPRLLVLLLLACTAAAAGACVRDTVDTTAVQWSSLIAQGKLLEVSERVEMKALALKPKTGEKDEEVSAVYWYRIYSFEIEQVLDGGNVKPKHRIEVVRFFGKVDDPHHVLPPAPTTAAAAASDPCTRHLTRAAVGQSFVLMLRPEQDIKMNKPPVWNDPKNTDPRDAEVHGGKAYAVIHLFPRAQTPAADLARLRKLIADTRAAEHKFHDPDIKREVQRIVTATSDADAAPAIATLTGWGYKSVANIKSARDKKETPAEAKERLAKLAIDLSPMPLTIQMEPGPE